ncbi:MAG: phosphotransferase family protein [Rubrobacter sp.]
MPFLSGALDLVVAEKVLSAALGTLEVKSASLVRYRAGRRALISYNLTDSERFGSLIVLGKIRARGTDERSHAVQSELHEAGFPVPRTLGLVPEFSMWLQENIVGVEATALLGGNEGLLVAADSARLVKRLHGSGVKPRRKPHTLADEIGVLEERLPLVVARRPELAGRIERLLGGSRKLACGIKEPEAKTGIHRDFYQDQVLFAEDSPYLLDLDLYCEGDPALDAGNFLAHIAEQSLREHDDPAALSSLGDAFLGEFVGGEEELAERVSLYRTLTLVRHVWISDRIPARQTFTPEILALCEELLAGE